MSRLSELIAELCPDGVEYKAIKDVYRRLKGTPITAAKMKKIASDDGEITVFAGGKTKIRAHEKDIPNANITRVPALLVQSRGVIDFVYCDTPFTFKNEMWAYTADDVVSIRYLMYCLKNNAEAFRAAASGMGSLPQISLKVTENYRIPVPPIEVQREVVRILDEYTATHDELVRQLEEEIHLQAHLRQAMHDEIVEKAIVGNEMISLGNVCQITDGDHQPPPKTELGIPFVTISCIDQRRMIDYSQASFVSDDYYKSLDESRRPLKGDVLLTVVGTLGVPVRVMNESPFVVQRHIAIMRPSKTVDQGFLYHYVSWSKFHSDAVAAATGSAQKTIGLRYLRKAEFPDIPIDEQILVSTQLDRLEHESVELKGRLTDDIELINQQLTLVRNQLLSFPEKVA